MSDVSFGFVLTKSRMSCMNWNDPYSLDICKKLKEAGSPLRTGQKCPNKNKENDSNNEVHLLISASKM